MNSHELISAGAYNALRDTYIEHPLLCECPSCTRMDAILDAMCTQTGCRNRRQPGQSACGDHPRRQREAH